MKALPQLITRKTQVPDGMIGPAPDGGGSFFEGAIINIIAVPNTPFKNIFHVQLKDDILQRINEFIKPEKSGGYRLKSQDWERALVPPKLIHMVDRVHVAIFSNIGEYLEIPDGAEPEMCSPQNGFGGFHRDPFGCQANMVLHKPKKPEDKLRSVVTVFGEKQPDTLPIDNDLSDCFAVGLYPNDALLFSISAPHAAVFHNDIGLKSTGAEEFGHDAGAYLLDLNSNSEQD